MILFAGGGDIICCRIGFFDFEVGDPMAQLMILNLLQPLRLEGTFVLIV